MTTRHTASKHETMAGPAGAGLGRFSGYNPYNGLPPNFRRTCRSINAITNNAHTTIHTSPAIRSGYSRNSGATASGPFT